MTHVCKSLRMYMLLAVSLPAGVAAEAAVDEPYIEIVPDRYTFLGQPRVEGWGVVPAPCCVTQASGTSHGMLLLMTSGELLLAQNTENEQLKLGGSASSSRRFERVAKLSPSSSLLVGEDGMPVAVASPTQVQGFECVAAAGTLRCTLRAVTPAALGVVHAAAVVPSSSKIASSGTVAFVASANGLFRVTLGESSTTPIAVTCIIDQNASGVSAPAPALLSVAATSTVVAAGNAAKVWTLAPNGTIVKWSWVTMVTTDGNAFGGVWDGAARAMEFDRDDKLYVGTDIALNVRDTTGNVARIAGENGLPYANITALLTSAVDPLGRRDGNMSQLWLGTDMGLVMRSSDAQAAAKSGAEWRYLYGPRYHPVVPGPRQSVTALALDRTQLGTVFASLEGGVVFLEQQRWTLEQKAERMQAALARHDRHGLTSECSLPTFGNLTDCANGRGQGNNDNNGLWTSLVVGAEYFRFHATNNVSASASAAHFLDGMRRLHNVTGIPGLYARSVCAPEDTDPPNRKICAPDRHTNFCGPCGYRPRESDTDAIDPPGKGPCPAECKRCGPQWVNSSVPGYEGWVWESDTSSDEAVGHFFAFSLAAQLAPTATERASAARTLGQMLDYLIQNGGNLVDWTGQPTTWGRWAPYEVNGWRNWSDTRALNSLQMLSFIEAARNASVVAGIQVPPKWEAWRQELNNATNAYESNLENLKIQTPIDDNFSDDELTFMPYYTLLMSTASEPERGAAARKSMERAWELVRPGRSDFWAAVVMATTGTRHESDIADLLWTLRTWPLELIQWPVNNTQRLDIKYQPVPLGYNGPPRYSERVIPWNERMEMRWNGSPFDVVQSGSGMSEQDPGAWLLPYWMARYHGILSSADTLGE